MRSIGTHCLWIGVPVMNCSAISIENGGLMKRKAAMSSSTAMNQPQKTSTATRTARRNRSRESRRRGSGRGFERGRGGRRLDIGRR